MLQAVEREGLGLQDQSNNYVGEDFDGFTITNFDGATVTV
jgi:hypothetical protein